MGVDVVQDRLASGEAREGVFGGLLTTLGNIFGWELRP